MPGIVCSNNADHAGCDPTLAEIMKRDAQRNYPRRARRTSILSKHCQTLAQQMTREPRVGQIFEKMADVVKMFADVGQHRSDIGPIRSMFVGIGRSWPTLANHLAGFGQGSDLG